MTCRNQGAPFPERDCGFHHDGPCAVVVISLDNGHFQAECPSCGWHTRESDQKRWARMMADRHELCCPAIGPLGVDSGYFKVVRKAEVPLGEAWISGSVPPFPVPLLANYTCGDPRYTDPEHFQVKP